MWGEWVLFEQIDPSMSHETNPTRRHPYVKRVAWAIIAVLVVLIVVLVLNDGPTRTSPRLMQARMEVQALEIALLLYEKEYGSALSGPPGEMMRALMGASPKNYVFFEVDTDRLTPEGVLLDPWKQPYHLDTSIPGKPRVYSSGRNQLDELGAEGSDDIASWRLPFSPLIPLP